MQAIDTAIVELLIQSDALTLFFSGAGPPYAMITATCSSLYH